VGGAVAPEIGPLAYRGRVRLTHFRQLMADEFGPVRAASLATDHVFAEFDGRTVDQALEAGYDPREVWRVVCRTFDVPPERR
jgi:hypothetical protein